MTRRRADERGAVLVEIALVAPILLALVFGIIELGLTFRDQLTAQDAVSDAARMGAIVGPGLTDAGTDADFEIIRTLRDGLGNIPTSWIDRIVIFRANPSGAGKPESQVTSACKHGTSGVSGVCNVYDANDAFLAVQSGNAAYFECTSAGQPACPWNPLSRDDGPDPATIQFVGVYIRIDRDALTGLFGSTHTVERAAVVRLEPGATEG